MNLHVFTRFSASSSFVIPCLILGNWRMSNVPLLDDDDDAGGDDEVILYSFCCLLLTASRLAVRVWLGVLIDYIRSACLLYNR